MRFQFKYVFLSAFGLSVVAAGLAPLSPSIRTRNAPGTRSADGLESVYRAISAIAARGEDTATKSSTLLDTSWNDAVLFS